MAIKGNTNFKDWVARQNRKAKKMHKEFEKRTKEKEANNYVWIEKDKIRKLVKPEKVEQYLKEGYKKI